MAEPPARQPNEKQQIERSITRARDGVSDRIDELDRRLRTTLDVKAKARQYAPQLIAGGAVVGLLVGFGMPKIFRRLVTFGVPIAIIAMTVTKVRNGEEY